jgi:hypothetical protein
MHEVDGFVIEQYFVLQWGILLYQAKGEAFSLIQSSHSTPVTPSRCRWKFLTPPPTKVSVQHAVFTAAVNFEVIVNIHVCNRF